MVDSWIALILASISSLTAFAWFALAMNNHWQQVMETTSSPDIHVRKILRILGCLGLLISAVFCSLADRPSMAFLVWIMLLAAAAPSIGMLLAWRPRLLRIVWPIGN